MSIPQLPRTADQALAALRTRQMSAVELMSATYDAIDSINPVINALVNVIPRDSALVLAQKADQRMAAGESGALLGLPIACKDGESVQGLPTTFGFAPWANNVARRDSLVVARQRAAGAIPIAKTNMPEFGLGSHTFNRLFGVTRNPYDADRTAGGSSGGAAAALAAGLLSVADGSDMGGSLRNPASFCNVVGFRPSIGRVPSVEGMGWFGRLVTAGPMARTVADVARQFAVLAGPDARDPLALSERFDSAFDVQADVAGTRVALSADFGLPTEPAVREVLSHGAAVFDALDCQIVDEVPDLAGAMDVFQTQRAAGLASLARALDKQLPRWRDEAKATMLWNVDQGLVLSSEDLLRSEARRSALYRRFVRYFDEVDYLAIPAAQVLPFDVDTEYPTEVDGVAMETYIDWMAVCCVISVTGAPAISVPGGFSDGLPVGLQIVGRPGDDLGVLRLAHAVEQATEHWRSHPPVSVWS